MSNPNKTAAIKTIQKFISKLKS